MNDADDVPVEATAQSVDPPVEEATRPVEKIETSTVSARKVAANRENSQKSTGPKTPKGKANSRTNASKHRLFAMDVRLGSLTKGENPQEYRAFRERLRQHYAPANYEEELAIDFVVVCWWRLNRAWRYENATVISSQFAISCREENARADDEACLKQLQSAQDEIKATGDISDELAEKIFAHEGFDDLWETIEGIVKPSSAETPVGSPPSAAEEPWRPLNREELLQATYFAMCYFKRKLKSSDRTGWTVAYDLLAIPKTDDLERILRANAAAEKDLHRALDRLERLQRRRRGEAVPPPVSVRLTR